MTGRGFRAKRMLVLLALVLASTTAEARSSDGELRILTLNVWHGLRSGESKMKFPGEDPERKKRRFDWQIEEIQRLDPDVLLFQEVNPNQPEARRYAEALGYDEIHKVTSCGVHFVFKIPKNMNEGLAILARPELGLRRVGSKRLSGDAMCAASIGFQTKESRYVLLGRIEVDGTEVLLATTHLSSPPVIPPDYEDGLAELTSEGVVSEEQRDEIVEILERRRSRNSKEVERLLAEIERHRLRLGSGSGSNPPVILTGDFNTEPSTPSIAKVQDAGFRLVGTGDDFLTWDPVRNHENHAIGTRRKPVLPSFEIPQLQALSARGKSLVRQIDFIFVSDGLQPRSAKRVLDREGDGMFPSDHYGILAVVEVAAGPQDPTLGDETHTTTPMKNEVRE